MAQRLTDALVRHLPLPEKNSKVHYDGDIPGFGVRITAAGARSFILRYRTRGAGRERTFTVGSAANWQTTAARAEAKRLRRLIDQGGDPVGDIEAEREAPTMAHLCDRFLAEHVTSLRLGTAYAYRMLVDNHVRPFFGQHAKVDDVVYADCDALHRNITKSGTPYAANRCVAVLSKMFSFAIRLNIRTDGVNPARGVRRNYEQKRKRYLRGDELARLTTALASHPNQQSANIVRLILLTGCRRGEAMSARWADFDLAAGTWSKPGSSTKQWEDHVAPLSAPARQLLSEIRAQQAAENRQIGPWVFPSTGASGHVVELARTWRAICESAGIVENLRIHDLRHSFASQLASGGASLPLIGALLGHSSPSTTHRYAHLFDDPQRAAAEKVGAVIAAAGKDAETGKDMVETFPEGGRRGR
jgi:integrase